MDQKNAFLAIAKEVLSTVQIEWYLFPEDYTLKIWISSNFANELTTPILLKKALKFIELGLEFNANLVSIIDCFDDEDPFVENDEFACDDDYLEQENEDDENVIQIIAISDDDNKTMFIFGEEQLNEETEISICLKFPNKELADSYIDRYLFYSLF